MSSNSVGTRSQNYKMKSNRTYRIDNEFFIVIKALLTNFDLAVRIIVKSILAHGHSSINQKASITTSVFINYYYSPFILENY